MYPLLTMASRSIGAFSPAQVAAWNGLHVVGVALNGTWVSLMLCFHSFTRGRYCARPNCPEARR